MKKIRVLLASSAVLLAIVGTFASGTFNTYYQPVESSGIWTCVPHNLDYTCSPGEGEACEVGFMLRESNTPLANPRCGQIVTRD